MKRLNRQFFLRPTLEVAEDLLGKFLVYETSDGKIIGEINEVEAYIGDGDPACHAANGRSKRNDVMFWRGGHAYVYFTYGMYHCLNIVTEKEGKAAAVLIRSVIPVEGAELMKKNRAAKSKQGVVLEKNLSNGPGKLCQALGIDLNQNGLDMVSSQEIYIVDGGRKPQQIVKTPRIGISKGKERLWRFVYP